MSTIQETSKILRSSKKKMNAEELRKEKIEEVVLTRKEKKTKAITEKRLTEEEKTIIDAEKARIDDVKAAEKAAREAAQAAREDERVAESKSAREQFYDIFKDFDDFQDFIHNQVCSGSSSTDRFCQYLDRINYETFTVNAPRGYSLFTVPTYITGGTDYPFFSAIKYIFSLIPHYNPAIITVGKTPQHTYMLILNRLIYYYNIHLLMNPKNPQLNGFRDTAGIVILVHGEYENYLTEQVKPVNAPIENLFICTKSSPGCVTWGTENIHYDQTITMMNNLINKKFVNFDEVAFSNIDRIKAQQAAECSRHHPMKAKMISRHLEENCHLLDKEKGRAMQHYINPNPHYYINKTYEVTDQTPKPDKIPDKSCYVIDLEVFSKQKSTDYHTRLKNSNILSSPYMISRIRVDRNNNMWFNLENIIDYCKDVLRKKTVFIYDRSCGGFKKTVPTEKIIERVDELARLGMGGGYSKKPTKRRNRKKSNASRKRKHRYVL